ncbi:MAG: hypothetical protein LBL71_03070 [Endomicrobium sp.]|jgi:hypothetical protein|nr:hypothetical protein [Endomicrobium sp.]
MEEETTRINLEQKKQNLLNTLFSEKISKLISKYKKIWDIFWDLKYSQILLYWKDTSEMTTFVFSFLTIYCMLISSVSNFVLAKSKKYELITRLFKDMLAVDIMFDREHKLYRRLLDRVIFYNRSNIWFIKTFPQGPTRANVFVPDVSKIPYETKILYAYESQNYYTNFAYMSILTDPSGSKIGLRNKIIVGLDHEMKDHWTYQYFIKHIQPVEKTPVPDNDKLVIDVNSFYNLQ